VTMGDVSVIAVKPRRSVNTMHWFAITRVRCVCSTR
jgi:hypothetical protein